MPKGFKITLRLNSFSAGDVERITDIGTVLQREWRRRGFLPAPPEGGKAKFHLFGLAELLVMQRLASHGVGPAVSSRVASMWGAVVAEHALSSALAYGGQFAAFMRVPLKELAFDPAAPDREPIARHEVQSALELWLVEGVPGELEETDIPELAGYSEEWSERIDTPAGRAEWLALHGLPMKGGLMYLGPQRYMVWWNGDRHERVLSLDQVFDAEGDKSLHGADSAFVLDARSLARTLVHRAGKPFVNLEIEERTA